MARPALLVVDPDSSRRRELARGLSGYGYEVVPAIGPVGVVTGSEKE
jgi:CheY-like chemotaxis protein